MAPEQVFAPREVRREPSTGELLRTPCLRSSQTPLRAGPIGPGPPAKGAPAARARALGGGLMASGRLAKRRPRPRKRDVGGKTRGLYKGGPDKNPISAQGTAQPRCHDRRRQTHTHQPNGTYFARRSKDRSHVGPWPLRAAQRHHGIKHLLRGACARWLLLRRTSQNSFNAKFAEQLFHTPRSIARDESSQ